MERRLTKEYLKEYLNEDPRHRRTEKHIKSCFPEDYEYILSLPGKSWGEKIYNFLHGCPPHACPVCGRETPFRSTTKGYSKYCSPGCASRDPAVQRKKEETCRERSGCSNPMGSEITREKYKKTCEERYGADYAAQSESVKEKIRATNMKKYGSGSPLQCEEVREKIRITNMKKYGSANPMQCPDVVERVKETNMKKYGSSCSLQGEGIRERVRATNLRKYGNEVALRSPIIRERIRKACQEKYGKDNPLTLPALREKSRQSWMELYWKNNEGVMDVFKNERGDVTYRVRCPHPSSCPSSCPERYYDIVANNFRGRSLISGCEPCTRLHPIGSPTGTSIELFVRDLLDEYNIEYTTNDRSVIPPREVDIYIQSHRIAIECNGVYWHSSEWKDRHYHYDKWKECKGKGVQLLTIWEDQVMREPDTVKSIILSKLGMYRERIYGRRCQVREVPVRECSAFLDKYHLQGSAGSRVRLGLYYNDELVSVMTFGQKRRCMGGGSDWELIRFCNKEGIQVTGGASKLFNRFLKTYHPSTITSFSSNDISDGGLYKTLGFMKTGETKDSYWYIDPASMTRYHRFRFRKDVLVREGEDPEKTEEEIMRGRGYMRIYDSGQSKWIYNIKDPEGI